MLRRWFGRRTPVELSPRDAYARWAERYPPRAHNPLMVLEERAVLALLPDVAGRVVLDAGCGTGRYLGLLADRGAARVVGVDASPEMLMRADRFRGRVVCADLTALPFASAAFEIVVCGLALGHIANLTAALGELCRVVAPGGWVVSSDMHPDGATSGWRRTFQAGDGRTYAAEHHIHHLADHLRACQTHGLTIEETREPVIDFEHQQRGRPAILAIRARRPC